jgi:hypothetical protein
MLGGGLIVPAMSVAAFGLPCEYRHRVFECMAGPRSALDAELQHLSNFLH